MGAYLDKPITDKDSHEEKSNGYHFAVSEMQGWRKSMEDAHITKSAIDGLDEKVSIFAVFDGHGGREVAKFCQRHMTEELVELEPFKEKEYGKALCQVFHHVDSMLRQSKFSKELRELRDGEDKKKKEEEEGKKANNKNNNTNSTEGQLDHADSEENDVAKENENKSSSDNENKNSDVCGSGSSSSGSGSSNSNNYSNNSEAEDDDNSLKSSMEADVRRKMAEAEEKGSLSKSEALDLVMKMMKLSKMSKEKEQQQQLQQGEGGGDLNVRYTDAGCTAIVTIIHDNKLYVANAGDSRGVLCCNKKAVALSFDHKPQSETELNRITSAGGFVSPVGRVNGNLNLSRSIGDLKYKVDPNLPPEKQIITAEPDIKEYTLSENDEYFVLACDGVFDVLSNDQLIEFINLRLKDRSLTLTQIVEKIFDECICDSPSQSEGIGADNMTCMIVLLKPREHFYDL